MDRQPLPWQSLTVHNRRTPQTASLRSRPMCLILPRHRDVWPPRFGVYWQSPNIFALPNLQGGPIIPPHINKTCLAPPIDGFLTPQRGVRGVEVMPSRAFPEDAVRDVATALFRHKRKSALPFIVVIAGTMSATPLRRRNIVRMADYSCVSGEKTPPSPRRPTSANEIVAVPRLCDSKINSVVEILQSRALLEFTVDHLGPSLILGVNDPGGTTAANPDAVAATSFRVVASFMRKVY